MRCWLEFLICYEQMSLSFESFIYSLVVFPKQTVQICPPIIGYPGYPCFLLNLGLLLTMILLRGRFRITVSIPQPQPLSVRGGWEQEPLKDLQK